MGVKFVWDNPEKTVLRFVHEGEWTWEEFHRANAEAKAQIESRDGTFYCIVDTGEGNYMPPNALTHLRNNPLMKHDQVGLIVIVISSRFIKVIASMTSRLAGLGQRTQIFATSVEQARTMISKAKASQV